MATRRHEPAELADADADQLRRRTCCLFGVDAENQSLQQDATAGWDGIVGIYAVCKMWREELCRHAQYHVTITLSPMKSPPRLTGGTAAIPSHPGLVRQARAACVSWVEEGTLCFLLSCCLEFSFASTRNRQGSDFRAECSIQTPSGCAPLMVRKTLIRVDLLVGLYHE